MKIREGTETKSHFWPRLLASLIAFAIVSVLVFGGVKNLMGELSSVYEALAASQSELVVKRMELDTAQNELDLTQRTLATTENKLVEQSNGLRRVAGALEMAGEHIRRLNVDRMDLKRGLRQATNELVRSNQQLQATDSALRAVESELQRQLQKPQLSVIVTTERLLQTSERVRHVAAHVMSFASGETGSMFYEGKMALYESEKSALYAERTQVVITQTAPGHDVLECLNDASKGCATIIAAQVSAKRCKPMPTSSQFSAMETLLWME